MTIIDKSILSGDILFNAELVVEFVQTANNYRGDRRQTAVKSALRYLEALEAEVKSLREELKDQL